MTQTPAPGVRVLGIRHHGPGSARALLAALEAYAPDEVLIEGPADADAVLPFAAQEGMVPPVALLAYDRDTPRRAVFSPFAEFSPEWQALRYAHARGVPVRFIDLPAATTLALRAAEEEAAEGAGGADEAAAPEGAPEAETSEDAPETAAPEDGPETEASGPTLRTDPIARLAQIAGYEDPEAWWDDAVEQATPSEGADPFAIFDDLGEAMALLREEADEAAADEAQAAEVRLRRHEAAREAHMRKELRAAMKRADRVAVVVGAWHVPALVGKLPPVKDDNEVLRGLPKAKVEVTWTPWTHSRLAYASNYGAGVVSPGWYAHLFSAPDRPITRWLTGVAAHLRTKDLPVSSAHVITAVQLTHELAALRGRPQPGLTEVSDAVQSIMLDGSALRLAAVTSELVVGEKLGAVPEDTPMVPLEKDLRATAKTLRLTFSASEKEILLDLRKPTDLAKSHLLRRLQLLGIAWGTPIHARSTGTFREGWSLQWAPEMSILLAQAGRLGSSVADAAQAAVIEAATSVAATADAIDAALLAGLPEALPVLLRLLDEQAAADHDLANLLRAVPSLIRSSRYGTVRRTDTQDIAEVARVLLARLRGGLPSMAQGLADEPSREIAESLQRVEDVIGLLDGEDGPWRAVLTQMLDRPGVHPALLGSLTRMLSDAGVLAADEVEHRVGTALSSGHSVEHQVAWVECFVAGSALLLIHDPRLLALLDGWLTALSEEHFVEVLPALRRAFGGFSLAERRTMVSVVQRGADRGVAHPLEPLLEAAGPALATLTTLMERTRVDA